MKLTKRQKNIAACFNPYYGGYSTPDEVRKVKLMVHGKYWNIDDFYEFVSFTPKGSRRFFPYTDDWKKETRQAARLWAQGKTREANKVYRACWDGNIMWD